ncbi:Calmodulin-4 [Fasciola gigantica]|uniref:Calmodulin-4 n=1 Tax=Fasciola gigantica TaxID=46835 RepID=A0A504Y8C9_FASGI|nr:Calmodulin-4 [Fasciola gigantica]
MNDQEIEYIFSQIDKNKNGRVNARELQAFFKKNDCKYKSKEIKEYIKRIDMDGDGQISLEELKQALRR